MCTRARSRGVSPKTVRTCRVAPASNKTSTFRYRRFAMAKQMGVCPRKQFELTSAPLRSKKRTMFGPAF